MNFVHKGGLRRRWLINSIMPVIVLLCLIAAMVSVAFANNHYANARASLESKANTGAEYFNTYVMTSYDEYYRGAALYANTFDSAGRIELQFLDNQGVVELSTRSLMTGSAPKTSDITDALRSGEVSYFQGKDPITGERVMSVCSLLKFNGSVVGLMRLSTSLKNVDSQVLMTVIAILSITLAIIFLIIMSSMLFVNNVVAPVTAVSEAAKRISGGSYGIQVPNPYTDEMHDLVDDINDMSVKIGRNEKMRSEFMSSVSHELRTPLTAINGWGETLLADLSDDGSCDPEAMRRGLTIICKESSRLSGMVEELLDFSKIEDGRMTLQITPLDLQAEFEDAIFTYSELYRQDGITLNYMDAGEIFDEPIHGDPERLKQVFCNLLDNARKHGGAGKRIDAHMDKQGHDYVLTIRDYGHGIPPEELPFVKQKFYKGSSKARGSGIGLAVCDEIIRLHGGTFDIANAKGGGTIVTIRLPLPEKNARKI